MENKSIPTRIRIKGSLFGEEWAYEDDENTKSGFYLIDEKFLDTPRHFWEDGNGSCDCYRFKFLPDHLKSKLDKNKDGGYKCDGKILIDVIYYLEFNDTIKLHEHTVSKEDDLNVRQYNGWENNKISFNRLFQFSKNNSKLIFNVVVAVIPNKDIILIRDVTKYHKVGADINELLDSDYCLGNIDDYPELELKIGEVYNCELVFMFSASHTIDGTEYDETMYLRNFFQ